jgi:hypothetical protein
MQRKILYNVRGMCPVLTPTVQCWCRQFQNVTSYNTSVAYVNPTSDTKCTMLGVSDQFCPPTVQVTPLKTPFELLTLLFQSQSHVVTITHNYCLHCYTLHCRLSTLECQLLLLALVYWLLPLARRLLTLLLLTCFTVASTYSCLRLPLLCLRLPSAALALP